MAEPSFEGIELFPASGQVRQLFVLLHGVGATSSDLLPLAHKILGAFPDAALLLPDGISPFDGGGSGRQWFSIRGVTDENRPDRVAAAIPALRTLLLQAQQRYNILPSDTALAGFSQGAIMALEYSARHDGEVGRVLAFSGRYAQLPDKAPELTTLHLLHGQDDNVIPVSHAHAGYARLTELQGDATLDIASSVGHELHDALVARAIVRLQTCVPLRMWQRALGINSGQA